MEEQCTFQISFEHEPYAYRYEVYVGAGIWTNGSLNGPVSFFSIKSLEASTVRFLVLHYLSFVNN